MTSRSTQEDQTTPDQIQRSKNQGLFSNDDSLSSNPRVSAISNAAGVVTAASNVSGNLSKFNDQYVRPSTGHGRSSNVAGGGGKFDLKKVDSKESPDKINISHCHSEHGEAEHFNKGALSCSPRRQMRHNRNKSGSNSQNDAAAAAPGLIKLCNDDAFRPFDRSLNRAKSDNRMMRDSPHSVKDLRNLRADINKIKQMPNAIDEKEEKHLDNSIHEDADELEKGRVGKKTASSPISKSKKKIQKPQNEIDVSVPEFDFDGPRESVETGEDIEKRTRPVLSKQGSLKTSGFGQGIIHSYSRAKFVIPTSGAMAGRSMGARPHSAKLNIRPLQFPELLHMNPSHCSLSRDVLKESTPSVKNAWGETPQESISHESVANAQKLQRRSHTASREKIITYKASGVTEFDPAFADRGRSQGDGKIRKIAAVGPGFDDFKAIIKDDSEFGDQESLITVQRPQSRQGNIGLPFHTKGSERFKTLSHDSRGLTKPRPQSAATITAFSKSPQLFAKRFDKVDKARITVTKFNHHSSEIKSDNHAIKSKLQSQASSSHTPRVGKTGTSVESIDASVASKKGNKENGKLKISSRTGPMKTRSSLPVNNSETKNNTQKGNAVISGNMLFRVGATSNHVIRPSTSGNIGIIDRSSFGGASSKSVLTRQNTSTVTVATTSQTPDAKKLKKIRMLEEEIPHLFFRVITLSKSKVPYLTRLDGAWKERCKWFPIKIYL
eukprot:CAMPEP_0115012838 /NCGR_PEP_ID=MMETSP0216-20121206/25001_1 /TAXON_ID=223996 /ORGANISM="Protocruzia adherens, Strain Boccale" /LENGTH=720 /DNA_ID=CAMNT_0002382023 /DNA_START=945 /DNA_END=3108 /DNA_ORIENTATION=+